MCTSRPRPRPRAPHGTGAPSLLLLAFAACAAGCGEPGATRGGGENPERAQRRAPTPPAPPLALAPPRHALPEPVVRWARGGSELDTTLAYARRAVADARNLYILDAGRGQILALRTSDGTVAWRRGGAHASATAPLEPTAITVLPGGGVAVVDDRRRTITLLDPEGRLRATRAIPASVGALRSICALTATHFIAATGDTSRTLVELRDDAPPRRVPLPWPDLAARHHLTTQAWLSGSADDARCAVALVLGRGFSLYDGRRYSPPHRYVESFELPGITRTSRTDGDRTVIREQLSNDRIAARDVALAGGRVAVAFGGESGLRARLVDFYDARSGAYAGTTVLDHRISALAAHGPNLYVIYQRQGRPAVAALADSSAASRSVALTSR